MENELLKSQNPNALKYIRVNSIFAMDNEL